ncbi:MAG: universal stress protein [Pseudomonadota bacterium]|nr:universal stress protein [Pseudomonadota bacterium]
MKHNTVVAFVDDSNYSRIVCQYAAWLAGKNNSKIKLYHILEKKDEYSKKDLSGAIKLGARTALLENLSESSASTSKTRHSEGWAILEKAQKTLESIGSFVVEPRLRTGDVAEALSRKEEVADVVLIGKRGEVKQDIQSRLGLNFERIVRASKKPIFVANRNFREIKKILVGFDGSPATRRIIDFISSYDFLSNTEVTLAQANKSKTIIHDPIPDAEKQLNASGVNVKIAELSGDPKVELARLILEQNFDLLAIGAYGHSKVRSFILGSTTSQLIQTVKVPVLLIR